ncbi:MAG: hypothetical protein JO364_09605 [Pseudonocardiales bacterium]|nr:hypothetical protein [Pseudonocardiales bacterium]
MTSIISDRAASSCRLKATNIFVVAETMALSCSARASVVEVRSSAE